MRILFFSAPILLFVCLLFWWAEQKLLYFPSKTLLSNPSEAGISYTNHRFASKFESIHAWHVDNGSDTTILYCHGNAGNIGDRMDKMYRFYLMGVNVFMFDYQGYGLSSGIPSERGMFMNGVVAHDYLMATGLVKENDVLVVYGTSLGGAVAAHIAVQRRVNGLVLENTFLSLRSIAAEIYPFLPKFLIPNLFDTHSYLKKSLTPKLIFHAKDDQLIPFHHGMRMREDAAGEVRFVETVGGHNESYIQSFDIWKEELLKFIERLKSTRDVE